ncbi:MAG: hypothetical protein ACKON9_31005 [Planctomycetaceae bacterium]
MLLQTDRFGNMPAKHHFSAKIRIPDKSAFIFRIATLAGFPYHAATTKKTYTLIRTSRLFREEV